MAETLSPSAARDGIELFHASPRDPIWEYVLSDHIALLACRRRPRLSSSSVTATSRSRSPGDGTVLTGGAAVADTEVALAGARRLLNPGSVGQPRDGDPRAAWLWLDLDAGHARLQAHRLRHSADAGRVRGGRAAPGARPAPRAGNLTALSEPTRAAAVSLPKLMPSRPRAS